MQLWRSAALGLAVFVVIAGPAQAANGVPVVSGATIAATEGAVFGQTIASVTDDPLKNSSCAPASDYTATVTWGDGSAADTGTVVFVSGPDQSNLCHYTVGGGHTFAEEGNDALSISVTGPNASTPGAGTGAAQVADAPLSATAPPAQSATNNTPFSGTVATFQDADPGGAVADYTAQVNWGDGTSSTATVSAASGGFTATASHTWSAAGAYTVSTTVADAGGATTSTSFTVDVVASGTTMSSPPLAPPGFRVSLSGPTTAVPLGSAARFTAQATPPPGTTVVAYRWRLQGSGGYNVDTGSNPQLSHRFTAGTHTVSMEAIASDGSVSSSTSSHVITTQTVVNLACIHDLPAGWIEVLDPGCIIVHQPPRSSHAITAAVGQSPANRAPGPGTGQGSTPQGLYYQIPIPTAGITLNGLEVQCPTSACTMTISPDYNFPNPQFGTRDYPYFLSTNKPVRLIMPNTMNGPVTLGNAQLAFEFVGLPYRDVASIPFQSVAIPDGTRFGDSGLSGLADIAIVRPTDSGPSYSVTFDLDIALFGQSFRHPTTIQGSSTGDIADAPGDWSIDLSGLPIPPLVIFNSLQISYQDHVDTPPGYMGVPLNHVLSGSGSAEVILTGDEVGAAMIVANGTPVYVHFSYDAGNGAVGVAPSGGGGAPGSGGTGPEPSAGDPAEGLASIDHLDATFRSDPYFEIAGGLTLSVAQYKAGGFMHYTAPYASTPFQLYLGATFPIIFPGLNGTVAVEITGDPDPGFGVSGQIAYSLDPWLDVNATLYMYVAWGDPNEIEFGISAGLKVLGIHIASGQGFVNQSWIAGCGVLFDVIQGWGVAPIAPGVGPGNGGWGGCNNIAPYSDAPELAGLSSVRGHAAAAGHYIQVTHHLSWANVKITSASGTPSVIVDGPGVHAVSSTAEGAHYADGVGTIVKSAFHTLVLGLHTPRLGRYTISAAPGSPPLTGVQSSLAVAPEIRARLTGRGENRTLRYTIARQPGQRVILTERSRHGFQRLATITGGGQGVIAFHPGQFGGRARTIIALPSLDGIPRGALTVAHYTAPPPLRPAAPAHLRLTYRARTSSVLASWRDRGAFRYRVVVSATDGRRLIVFTRRARLTIGTVFPGTRVSLTVRGQTGMLRDGPARSTHLRLASRSRHRPPRQRRR